MISKSARGHLPLGTQLLSVIIWFLSFSMGENMGKYKGTKLRTWLCTQELQNIRNIFLWMGDSFQKKRFWKHGLLPQILKCLWSTILYVTPLVGALCKYWTNAEAHKKNGRFIRCLHSLFNQDSTSNCWNDFVTCSNKCATIIKKFSRCYVYAAGR